MLRLRLWLMLAALVWSASTVQAISPSVASLQALHPPCCEESETCPQMLRMFACGEGECPAISGCPVLNASTSWLVHTVQQGMSGWKLVRTLCSGPGDCCEGSEGCQMPKCCAGSCVTGAADTAKKCVGEAKTGECPGIQVECPFAGKVIKIESPTAPVAGCCQGCDKVKTDRIVVRGQVVVTSPSCCGAKDCTCCEMCKAKKTTMTLPATCCPFAGCQIAPPPPAFPAAQVYCGATGPAGTSPKVVALVAVPHAGKNGTMTAVCSGCSVASQQQAHLVTPDIEARCEKMARKGDMVLLEGNVHLECTKNGVNIRIEAHRVMLNIKDGTFTVESNPIAAPRPVNGTWNDGCVPGNSMPTTGRVIFAEPFSGTPLAPTYRMIQMSLPTASDAVIPPPPPPPSNTNFGVSRGFGGWR